MPFTWETLDASPPVLRRARTPRGWLISYGSAPLIEIADPEGTWLAPVVIPPVVVPPPPPPPPPVVVPPPPPPVVRVARLGTNLASIADYEPEQPFANLFHQSRAWISSDSPAHDDGRPIDLDADGNVRSLLAGQKLSTLFYWDLPAGSHPVGEHVLTWTGSGNFVPFNGATVKSTAPNRVVLNVTGPWGLLLDGVVAASPPRALSVTVTGNKDPKWNDAFIASLGIYDTLRFMDWQRTNDTKIVNPADMPTPSRLRYDGNGVALDDCLALCNQLGARPWFCVPHQATNATVATMASKVKALLRADLDVFVEYSNEVWNSQFPQAAYAQSKGVAAGLAGGDPTGAQLLFHAQRTREVGAIFRATLGTRAKVVLGAQSVATYWMDGMLASLPAGAVDAVAIAPYFGGSLGSKATTASMTLDQLVAALGLTVDATGAEVAAARAIADKYKVQLISYEAGQHLVGIGALREDARLNALFDAVNADPRMEGLYARYLFAWDSNASSSSGGALLTHFTNVSPWTKYGRWGSMRHPRDLQSPKRRALAAYAARP